MGSRVRLIEGDFRQSLAAARYRLAFALMNTFLHLGRPEQPTALRAWHAALAPGGRLLLDVFAPDVAELAALDGRLEWDRTWTDPSTGRQVMKLLARTVDPAEQVMQVSHIYDEIDAEGIVRRSTASFDLHYVWRFEAELLLEKAGFEVEALYGDWEGGEFDNASEKMIFAGKTVNGTPMTQIGNGLTGPFSMAAGQSSSSASNRRPTQGVGLLTTSRVGNGVIVAVGATVGVGQVAFEPILPCSAMDF